MEFRYSTLVDPSTYGTDDLICDGYSLRVSKHKDLDDLGTIRAHEDWREHVSPVGLYKGSLGPEYNFVSVALPECLPDRVEIVAYINEIIFLHDDSVEDAGRGKVCLCLFPLLLMPTGGRWTDMMQGDELNNRWMDVISSEKRPIQDKESGRRKLQKRLMQKMMSIDKPRAIKTMAMWTEFLERGAGRQNHIQFDNLREFVEYRMLDVGKMYWMGVLTFGMALDIPDEEMETCSQLCHPAWVSCALINDLYSWPKEHKAFREEGGTHVNNSVWVLMKEHGFDEAKAVEKLMDEIRKCFTDHKEVLAQNSDRTDLSVDLRRLMDALQYSMIANVAWSRVCPRYNEDGQFSEQQLRWMADGTPGLPGIMGTGKEDRLKFGVGSVKGTSMREPSKRKRDDGSDKPDEQVSRKLRLTPARRVRAYVD